MKTKIFPIALVVAIVAISAIFVFQSCQKSVGPFDPSMATYQYTMRGQVVDEQTNSGIPSASVRVFDKVITTDVNGYFTFKVSYATAFPFQLYAEAPNYVLGNTLISGPSQVRAIRLTMQNPGVILNETGGTIIAQSHESLTGGSFELAFPAGALSQSVSLAITPMEAFYFMYDQVSSKTTGLIDMATITVSPKEYLFLKPVTLYCPLPFANDKDTQFPVLRYNETTHTWVNTGKTLLVDATRTGGRVEITQGGIYSVAGEGTFTEEMVSQSFMFDYSCQGDSPLIWQAIIEHPEGIPSGVSETWLKNTVSHNSVIGGHVSFLTPTSTSIVCESYQPGSSNPVPSDEILLPAIPVCPSGTNPILLDEGVSINNRIINGVLSFNSYSGGMVTTQVSSKSIVEVAIHAYAWKCLHDQGGGK
jgi:hypothetical protein